MAWLRGQQFGLNAHLFRQLCQPPIGRNECEIVPLGEGKVEAIIDRMIVLDCDCKRRVGISCSTGIGDTMETARRRLNAALSLLKTSRANIPPDRVADLDWQEEGAMRHRLPGHGPARPVRPWQRYDQSGQDIRVKDGHSRCPGPYEC